MSLRIELFYRKVLIPFIILLAWDSRSFAQEKLHISGYGNAHSMDHSGLPKVVGKDDPNDQFFQLREFSLFFDFQVSEGIIASLEIEASDNAHQLIPNYAYAEIELPVFWDSWDTELFGSLNLRVGKILVPFLSYTENKANFKQNLMSQPFTAWQLVPAIPSPPEFEDLGWTDVGIILNWNKEIGDFGLFDLKLSIINGLGSDSNALDENFVELDNGDVNPGPFVRIRDGLFQNEIDETRDNNNDKATVIKATYVSTVIPVDIGVSWYFGAWDKDSKNDLGMVGLHLNWLARNWTLKGEWVVADVEEDVVDVNGVPINPVADQGFGGPPFNANTGDYDMVAWYIEGSYIPLRYGDDHDRYFRLTIRYDEVDTNDEVTFTPFDRDRLTLGSEWQFSPNAQFRYEWQYHELHDFDEAPQPFKDAGGEENVEMHMVSVIFWF